jgi:hypothetical protein
MSRFARRVRRGQADPRSIAKRKVADDKLNRTGVAAAILRRDEQARAHVLANGYRIDLEESGRLSFDEIREDTNEVCAQDATTPAAR